MSTYIKTVAPKTLFYCVKVAMVVLTITLGMPSETKAYTKPIAPVHVHSYRDDSESYLYAGMSFGAGVTGFNADHPELGIYKDLNLSPYFPAGMVGLLTGYQITKCIAMDASFEFIIGYKKYRIVDSYLHNFKPREVECEVKSHICTFGLALDIVPTVPVSDEINLLAVVGVGYKTANIKILGDKPFDRISWWIIPRLGLGVNLNTATGSLTIKLLGDFNNLFQAKSEAILSPSFLCCTNLCLNFK